MRATTGTDGVANFEVVDDTKEYWFRPMSSRNQGRDGYYGHLRVQVLKGADSETLPPTTFMDDSGDSAVTTWLVFTTRPQHVEATVRSDPHTIQRRTLNDELLTKDDLVVYLYSTSAGGVFEIYDAGSASYITVTSVTILDGNDSVNFYYTDSTTGNPVLTASTEVLA